MILKFAPSSPLLQTADSLQGGPTSSQGKVNILLQSYISKLPVEDFALVSDMAYVAQNAGRIARALLEIAISRNWAAVASVLIRLCVSIERRLWALDHPMVQFLHKRMLKEGTVHMIERWANNWEIEDLASMSAAELGALIHLNEKHGEAVLACATQFPSLDLDYRLRPLGSDVLKVAVHVTRKFSWNDKVHGHTEWFFLWIEDEAGLEILQITRIPIRRTSLRASVEFVISIPRGVAPPSFTIRYLSEAWLGAEDEVYIPLDLLVMPPATSSHTPRLDLPFLSPSAVRDQKLRSITASQIGEFGSLQTQVFWTLSESSHHSLVCAPSGSGMSFMACLLTR